MLFPVISGRVPMGGEGNAEAKAFNVAAPPMEVTAPPREGVFPRGLSHLSLTSEQKKKPVKGNYLI